MRPDAVQIRVLGALLEKQRTTPDTYPLTLNALRAACNQSTNRDPVVDYDERTIRAALEELSRRRWTRNASGPGSRAPKYRHLLADTLQIEPAEQAILAVLMLRGPQTPGELRSRTERLHRFTDQDAVDATLVRLIERGLVERLERRPGQKEARYRQLLGGEEDAGGASVAGGATAVAAAADPGGGAAPTGGPNGGGAPAAGPGPAPAPVAAPVLPPAAQAEIAALRGRVEALESEVSRLRAAFRRLQEELGVSS
ncbi:YceH family protein [Patulibacter defluvii]|uniref:YceH family protein n=1 Tax=Patulibacter defluvii TaxID=3095358 RepID=UPI002A753E88|nr:YceH family protein [Patulibacter sp. DM4]